jgi:pimeloyl-ACP methyl ester carboxylesterase
MPTQAAAEAVLLSPRQAPRVYGEFATLLPDSVKVRMRDLIISSRSWERGEWTVAAESAALERWLDGEGIKQCHLVAESGAAAVGLMFATTSSHRLRSLAICEPPWIGADFPSVVDVEFRQELRRLVDLPNEEVAPAFFRLMANGLDPPERPVDLPFVAALRAVADEYLRAPLDRAMLAAVAVPVLLVVGGSSTQRMRVITDELAQLLPRSVVVEVPGAHHFNLWRVGAHTIAPAWVDHCLAGRFGSETLEVVTDEGSSVSSSA